MKHTVTKKTLRNGTPVLVIDLRKLGEAVICCAIIVAITLLPSIIF